METIKLVLTKKHIVQVLLGDINKINLDDTRQFNGISAPFKFQLTVSQKPLVVVGW